MKKIYRVSPKYLIRNPVNRTPAKAAYMRPKKGVLFSKGHISRQKLAQKTSIETRYKLFQRHVSFYILKISEGCFVCDAPPLLISPLLYNIALNSLKIRGYRENRCKVYSCAQRGGYLVSVLKKLRADMIECNSIPWNSGNTRLLWWNTPGFESLSGKSSIYFFYIFTILWQSIDFHLFFLRSQKYRVFLLVKNSYKNPYNWSPVDEYGGCLYVCK
jgi:hypothetical protein